MNGHIVYSMLNLPLLGLSAEVRSKPARRAKHCYLGGELANATSVFLVWVCRPAIKEPTPLPLLEMACKPSHASRLASRV